MSKDANASSSKPTKPANQVLPPRPPIGPQLPRFQKPKFNTPKFNTSFRTQNRGGGGK